MAGPWLIVGLLFALALATAKAAAQDADLAYQDVTVELFLGEDDDNDETPCASPDNYTLVFKGMKLDNGRCVTHLFPQLREEAAERWLQFSAKATLTPDAGLQVGLYFTRDELTGAITHCAQENIDNLPYPIQVSAGQSSQCQVINLPRFADGDDGNVGRSLAIRITYDVDKAQRLLRQMQTQHDANATPSSGSSAATNVLNILALWAFLSLSFF
jgi:hypothetical protein